MEKYHKSDKKPRNDKQGGETAVTSATGQEQQTSAWPTTEESRKNLGRTWLEGRITESRQVGVDRENMPIFETILMTPAADKYS